MKTNKDADWPVSDTKNFSEMFKNCKATPDMLKKAILDGNTVLVNILKKELNV